VVIQADDEGFGKSFLQKRRAWPSPDPIQPTIKGVS
jgi:hypothetical protein